jgi:hypothetical protein
VFEEEMNGNVIGKTALINTMILMSGRERIQGRCKRRS